MVALTALGERIRDERARRDYSLERLADRAKVSRSMLSAVERGEKVPTVLVLDRIATGLGTSIACLLTEERRVRVALIRADQQDVARDPSGWERRISRRCFPGWSSSSCAPPGRAASTRRSPRIFDGASGKSSCF